MKYILFIISFFITTSLFSQEHLASDASQTQTQLKVKQLVDKKAEYHRLNGGSREGYRIKIHFGVDRDVAEAVRVKFSNKFVDFTTDMDYQQPNFVVLVGDYKSKLEAFESLKKIQSEFPNSFIVKGKIKIK